MNSKKLLTNFEFSNHRTLRIFSTAVVDSEKERRGLGPSSLFLKDKDSTHTHLITRDKTAWNVNLMIHLVDTYTILPPLSPDKDQSFVSFGSQKDHGDQ